MKIRNNMYIARDLDKVKKNQNHSQVGIFRIENEKEEQVGEYERDSYTRPTTFYSFQKDGKDFALYSPHYSEIRIMELPSCKDIGVDESQPGDFCSIEFYVPSYMEQEVVSRMKNSQGNIEESIWTARVNEPTEEDLIGRKKSFSEENGEINEIYDSSINYRPLTSRLYYPFGFVSGCYWMDDFTVHLSGFI